jgi:hypothetical protein
MLIANDSTIVITRIYVAKARPSKIRAKSLDTILYIPHLRFRGNMTMLLPGHV